MLHCNTNFAWHDSRAATENFSSLVASYSLPMVVAQSAEAKAATGRKSREAGTCKRRASRAARSAHCSKNTQPELDLCDRHGRRGKYSWAWWGSDGRVEILLTFLGLSRPRVLLRCRSPRDQGRPPVFAAALRAAFAGGGQVQRLPRAALQRRYVRHRSLHRCGALRDRTSHRHYEAGNFRRLEYLVANPFTRRGPPDSAEGAGQRLLAIGRHDRRARRAAHRRIALALLVLGDQPRALFRIRARGCAAGWTITSTLPVAVTASTSKPSRRQ